MGARHLDDELAPRRARREATTAGEQEDMMISLAFDVARKQMEEGTVSAQVLTHYLKLGSSNEKLQQEKLRMENNLLQIKADTLASEKRIEALFQDAINAMKSYQGHTDEE